MKRLNEHKLVKQGRGEQWELTEKGVKAAKNVLLEESEKWSDFGVIYGIKQHFCVETFTDKPVTTDCYGKSKKQRLIQHSPERNTVTASCYGSK